MEYKKETLFGTRIKRIFRFYQKDTIQFVEDFQTIFQNYFDITVLKSLVNDNETGYEEQRKIVKAACALSLCETDISVLDKSEKKIW